MSKVQSAEEIRTRMQSIDPYDFEDFVGELWEEEGWKTSVSQGSNDQGVDVIGEKRGTIDQKIAIQAKRYSDGNKVGRPKIQQYHSMKEQDTNADAAVVVTTSSFTDKAQLWAHDHNVKLVDGDDLVDMIRRHGREDLLEEYAPSLSQVENEEEEEDESSNSVTKTPKRDTQNDTSSSLSNAVEFDNEGWFNYVIAVAVIQVSFVAFTIKPAILPILSADAALGIFSLFWFIGPAPIFLDALRQHNIGASYKPNRITWAIASFCVPVIVPVWYVFRRMET